MYSEVLNIHCFEYIISCLEIYRYTKKNIVNKVRNKLQVVFRANVEFSQFVGYPLDGPIFFHEYVQTQLAAATATQRIFKNRGKWNTKHDGNVYFRTSHFVILARSAMLSANVRQSSLELNDSFGKYDLTFNRRGTRCFLTR